MRGLSFRALCVSAVVIAFAVAAFALPQGPPSGAQQTPPSGSAQRPAAGQRGAGPGAPSGQRSLAPRSSAAGPVPDSLLTIPERTNYIETSLYSDVMDFMRAAARKSPQIHLTTFGYSFEGRALPLAVIGANDATPEAVRATGKLRIYIQANIHAGEVEGKEACLEILRAIANGQHQDWLKTSVLLIAPIFNPDGNDRITLTNRGRQNGPIGGMGQRTNAQLPNNLDLNRDFMKMESPEDRSMALLYQRYDPHLEVSLHTTDGSIHAYQLTYNSPLHPATAQGVMDVLRTGLLPAVTKAVKARDGYDFYYYGNLPFRRGAQSTERVFSADPDLYTGRFEENYIGLRNRLAILSETFAYLTFKDRIAVARRFVEEIVNYGSQNAGRIMRATEAADKESIVGRDLAVLGRTVRSAQPVTILMGETENERNPYTGQIMLRRKDVSRPEQMYEAITFEAAETSRAPRAYVVPATIDSRALQRVVDRLAAHGIRTETLAGETTVAGEQFGITETTTADREYQGHTSRTIVGAWEPASLKIPAGSLVIPVDQPLGRLVFELFEPRSPDSFAAWNVLDEEINRNPKLYPVLRTMETIGTAGASK